MARRKGKNSAAGKKKKGTLWDIVVLLLAISFISWIWDRARWLVIAVPVVLVAAMILEPRLRAAKVRKAEQRAREEEKARIAAAQAKLDALPQEEKDARIRQLILASVPKSDAEKTGEYDREYTCVGIFRPADVTGPMPAVGDYLEPEEEPDNAFDSDAILLRDLNGEPVGYFNRGKLREAVRIGLEQGAPMVVQVSRADDRLEVYVGIDKVE